MSRIVTIKRDIDEVIAFLVDRMNEGYKFVDLIDNSRARGWMRCDEGLDFAFYDKEPYVVGIKAWSEEREI